MNRYCECGKEIKKGFQCQECLKRKNGIGTNPEPEQDERIREAFEKRFPEIDNSSFPYKGREACRLYENFKSGYTSRNSEVEALKGDLKEEHISYKKAVAEMNRRQIEINVLKAEIESLQCCGNCGTKINGKCAVHAEELHNGEHCGQWTSKTE